MRHLLIICLLSISTIITGQTILTNVVSIVGNNEAKNIRYRNDTFYIKNNLILWNSIEGSVIYYIDNYSKISDNKYIIHCNTYGKLATFIVHFGENYVIINSSIIFCKILKL
jgi:uncharacterized membrane protein